MTDHWLYSENLPAAPADWTLEGSEAQHARARRLTADEPVHLFDGRGRVCAARVRAADKRVLRLRIETSATLPPRLPRLTVAVSPPKGDRLDWMLEKLTELGVAAILPIRCKRSVVQAKDDRLERWHRRCVEAAKQAHVAHVPAVAEPLDLAQLLGGAGEFTHTFVPDTVGSVLSILSVEPLSLNARPVVIIGPEGGFADHERDLMTRSGARTVGLGPTVLRTETAAIVAAACLLIAADARADRTAGTVEPASEGDGPAAPLLPPAGSEGPANPSSPPAGPGEAAP